MVKRQYTGPARCQGKWCTCAACLQEQREAEGGGILLVAAMAHHTATHVEAGEAYSWWHEARGQADGYTGHARSMAGFSRAERWSYLNGYQYAFRIRKCKGREEECMYWLGKAMHHPRIPQVPFVIYA